MYVCMYVCMKLEMRYPYITLILGVVCQHYYLCDLSVILCTIKFIDRDITGQQN